MQLLSSIEVQGKLGISRPTLYLWVRQGKLKPQQRAGRALRFAEDEIMRLLGKGPRVAAWIERGRIEQAKREVVRKIRSNARPSIFLEYLTPPQEDFVRARVVTGGDGGEIRSPAPGGAVFEALRDSLNGHEHGFLSHEDSIWLIHDVRAETSPAGESYIAMELVRPKGPGEGDERDRRLREFVKSMRSGIFSGRIKPWTRNELNERGPD